MQPPRGFHALFPVQRKKLIAIPNDRASELVGAQLL